MTKLSPISPTARSLAPPAAIALVVVAVIHLIDGPGALGDHVYIGALELALAAACVPLAILLTMRPLPALWSAALALNTAALAAFVASRTVGLPGSSDDIGNWSQVLGVVNLAAELVLIALATTAVRAQRSAQPRRHAAAAAR